MTGIGDRNRLERVVELAGKATRDGAVRRRALGGQLEWV